MKRTILKTILVTLSGTHGSGKSTNAGKCYYLLNKAGMKFSYVRNQDILDPFGFVLRRTARVFRFKNPTDLERTRPWSILWSMYILFVYFPILAGGIELRRLLGYNVVSDRYVYDMLVGFAGDEVEVPVMKLLPRILPRPDVSFVFSADENRIVRVRPEHTIEFIQKEKRLYDLTAEKFGLEKVSTDDPPSVVWRKVYAEIGRALNGSA